MYLGTLAFINMYIYVYAHVFIYMYIYNKFLYKCHCSSTYKQPWTPYETVTPL